MKKITFNKKDYLVLVDSERENKKSFLIDDINFLLDKNLFENDIENKENVNVCFVGEVITPNNNFISLPKNFQINIENLILIKNTLNEYKDIEKDGKKLISNKSFVFGEGINSDIFIFNKLKQYFLDFITYKFIYPKERLKINSNKPIKGLINIFRTISTEDRYLPGNLCYDVKDIKNSKTWILDDIYYTTLKKLAKKYGSKKDRRRIEKLRKYLISMGYDFEKITINNDTILQNIEKCNVGIIHFPIKEILLRYYKNTKLNEKYTIFAFYTKKFNYIWESLCRKALKHDKDFKKKIEWIEPDFKKSNPDVFSDYKGHKIIADSKYYRTIEKVFYKELYEYNDTQNNKYPIIILIPDIKTSYIGTDRHKEKELIKIGISLREIINDVIVNDTVSIDKIHTILSSKSVRW